MTVYSMTGYASCQSPATQNTQPGEPAQVGIGLEIRSVNSRFLDLSFRVSDELRSAEPLMREHITKHLKRGKVEVRAWIERQQDGTQAVPDTASLERLLAAQTAVKAVLHQAAPLSVSQVLQMGSGGQVVDATVVARAQSLLEDAVDALRTARAQEGGRLAQTITERTASLRALCPT